jgi:transaldolase
MQLFLDSADTEEIGYALEYWNIDGITTNPRHVGNSGKPYSVVLDEIGDLVQGTNKPVSVQVDPHLTDWTRIVDEAMKLREMSPNFVIKVGAGEDGFRAVQKLSSEDVPVNVTLVFTVTQAWHAARSGAAFVSPFLGWKNQFGDAPDDLIADTAVMLDNFGYSTQIIAAAIRSTRDIGDASLAGAHIVTASATVIRDSFNNPYTTMGVKIFGEAWDAIPHE